MAEAYTLHNLKDSTVYKVQVVLVFREAGDRMLDYWEEIQIPGTREVRPIKSDEIFFNTAQLDVDEYIEQELEEARRTRRNISHKIAFCQSEKVLYRLAHESETKDIFDV